MRRAKIRYGAMESCTNTTSCMEEECRRNSRSLQTELTTAAVVGQDSCGRGFLTLEVIIDPRLGIL